MFFTLGFSEPGIVPDMQNLIKEALISAMTPMEGLWGNILGMQPSGPGVVN